jgi:hypothetical protein
MKDTRPFRLPIMVILLVTLLLAMWAGLIRMGWSLAMIRPSLPAAHGPLMIGGFLGTLIALERVIALGKNWAYIVPLLGALGAVALIIGLPVGPLLITLCSLGFVVLYVLILRIQLAMYTVTMALGAVTWLVGNGLWLAGWSVPMVAPWWVAFLVLTIVGERLELSRVARLPSYSQKLFGFTTGVVLIGLLVSLFSYANGVRLTNLGFLGLALWLGLFDIARRTVHRHGLTRFIAVNLLLGYLWLGVGALIGIRYAGYTAGPWYDAWLHALLLGFVFSMIFAHALIILPAVSGVSIPFRRVLYAPATLLQVGLVIRIVGDIMLLHQARLWGGMLNGLAILTFFIMVAALAIGERRRD